jgi:hypothetical protein
VKPRATKFRGQRPRLQHQRFDFSSVGPIIGTRDKASAHRILKDVIPFLAVAFARPKHVIKEFALPKGSCSRSRRPRPKNVMRAPAGPPLPSPHELGKSFGLVFGPAEKMNVIWHDHIAPDCPAVAISRGRPFIDQDVGYLTPSE